MPAWTMLSEWAMAPASLEAVVWGMCAVFALLLIATLAAFGVELASLFREGATPTPAGEFQGFGRAAPRVGGLSRRVF